VHIKMLSQR